MKKLLCLLLLVLFVACAAGSPTQSYRPANYTGAAWDISGDFNGLTKRLIVKINGETAIDDRLPLLSSGGEVKGQYKNHKVVANCFEQRSLFTQSYQCIVFVDNDRAATLQF